MATVRVLHLLPDLAVGGGQVIVRNLVSAPVSGVHHVVGALAGGPLEDAFLATGVPLRIGDGRGLADLPNAIHTVTEWVRAEDIDVIHTNNTPIERLSGQSAAALTGRPVVNTLMAIASSHRPRAEGEALAVFVRRRLGNLANRGLHRWNVARAVAISDAVRRSHAEALGVGADEIDVVFPGVPDTAASDAERRAVRAELDLAGAYPVLVSVGRLEANKGQRDLVPAFARLVAQRPDACLLVVGEGDDHAPLEAGFAEAGVRDRVRFLGRRSDVPALCAASDVFVSTSHHEGFGMAALEAMAGGCPVVAYVNPFVAIAEFVVDGETGRLVAPDAAALGDALVDVAADPDRLRAMGRAAVDAAANLTAHHSAEQLAVLYRAVVASNRPSRRRQRGGAARRGVPTRGHRALTPARQGVEPPC